jgi:phosphoesterase RecJ-like protein
LQIGKTAEMVCRDSVPKPFLFLDHIEEIQHDLLFGDFDLIVVIDCGDLNRTGFPDRLKKYARSKKKTIINIDHHPKNDLHKLAQFNLVDYQASSTSEIIYNLILQMNLVIDKNIATALLTGLYTDTGGFKHANTTSQTLQIAGDLMRSGGRIKLITQNIALNKTVSAMKLWGMVLHRLHRNHLGIVSSVVTREDLKKCEATDDDLAGVVNLINSIPGAKAAILFYETTDQKIRASIRTESDRVDVSRLAQIFGGGGHKRAAGFTVDGKLKINGAKWQIEFEKQ